MKRFFTLIELLCVIAVIAILMGILLPALSSVKQKGKEAKAKADMNSIVAACKAYEADYGVLPDAGGDKDSNSDFSFSATTTADNYYKNLFQLLTGVTYLTSTSAVYNIRNIRYLEVPSTYATAGYVDPWNNTYGIGIDNGYNGQIVMTYPSGAPSAMKLTPVLSSVAVYSVGMSGASGSKYLYSWK